MAGEVIESTDTSLILTKGVRYFDATLLQRVEEIIQALQISLKTPELRAESLRVADYKNWLINRGGQVYMGNDARYDGWTN